MFTASLVTMLAAAVAIACLMLLVWIISLLARDASLVDLAWGSGFVVVAWVAFAVTVNSTAPASAAGVDSADIADPSAASLSGSDWRRLLLPVLATLWGGRLTAYLAWRNLGHGEDYRYREMREHWGNAFPLVSLFMVFGLQGVVMWVVSLPMQTAIAAPEPPDSSLPASLLVLPLGLACWLVGCFFETVGDWQLARFKANPENKGKVLDTGLWRYTRHPNYFGDFMVWWGFYLTAVGLCPGSWWTIVGPALMSFALLRISGVTLLEKSLTASKPGYAAYQARTSAFFPWWPKQPSESLSPQNELSG